MPRASSAGLAGWLAVWLSPGAVWLSVCVCVPGWLAVWLTMQGAAKRLGVPAESLSKEMGALLSQHGPPQGKTDRPTDRQTGLPACLAPALTGS